MDNPAGTDNAEKIRYLCRVLDDGHFSYNLRWDSVIRLISYATNLEETNVEAILKGLNIGFTGDRGAGFLVGGVYDAHISGDEKELLFERLAGRIKEEATLKNLLVLVSSGYEFTLDLLDFLFLYGGKSLEIYSNNAFLPTITSDLFIEGRPVNSLVKESLGSYPLNMDRFNVLSGKGWFLDLMSILRSGNSATLNRSFENLSERHGHEEIVSSMNGLIEDGTLPSAVIHKNRLLKQPFLLDAFENKREAEEHVKVLQKRYYWLGVANDFILGVLFLVGSIEFLPLGNEFAGVVMFIVGSAQLVGRSIIKIVMSLHIRSHLRKKLTGGLVTS